MQEDKFWSIVEAARKAAGSDIDGRVEALEAQLRKLSTDDIQGFQKVYDTLVHRAFRWDLWGAAHIMNGDCSDDGFVFFCHWLISEGKARYEAALQDPDSLAEVERMDLFELEMYAYVAQDVFEDKDGEDFQRDTTLETTMPAGKAWKEEALPAMFPRLTAVYGS